MDVTVDLTAGKDKSVLRHTQSYVQYFSESDFQSIKFMPLVFEDKIGILPGQYQMNILVYNKITSQSYRFEKTVEVPETPAAAPGIGPLMLVDRVQPAPADLSSLRSLIFTFFGYSFTPLLERTLHPSDKLNVLFQIYYPADKARQESGEALTMEYRFLGVGGTGAPVKTVTDSILKGKANSMGCLLTYKQLPLEELLTGRYTLVVAAKEPSGRMVASSSIVFTLDASKNRIAQRDFASEQLGADDSGLYEYQRGLILLHQGPAAEALARLRTASLKSPGLTNLGLDLASSSWNRATRRSGLRDGADPWKQGFPDGQQPPGGQGLRRRRPEGGGGQGPGRIPPGDPAVAVRIPGIGRGLRAPRGTGQGDRDAQGRRRAHAYENRVISLSN